MAAPAVKQTRPSTQGSWGRKTFEMIFGYELSTHASRKSLLKFAQCLISLLETNQLQSRLQVESES
jgi:hypothetical protein